MDILSAELEEIETRFRAVDLTVTPVVSIGVQEQVGTSLAALDRQLREAREAFRNATTEAGREGAFVLVQQLEQAIEEIERLFRGVDLTLTPSIIVGEQEVGVSLASLRRALRGALDEFEAATTESARAAANETVRELQAAIGEIERLYRAVDLTLTPSIVVGEREVGVSLATLRRDLRDANQAFVEATTSAGREAAFALIGEIEAAIEEIDRLFRGVDLTIQPVITIQGEEQAGSSLAALREQLRAAREEFSAATTAAGREAAFSLIQELEGAIEQIERLFRAIDVTVTPVIEVAGLTVDPVREDLAARLAAAAAAAELFGRENELAAVSVRLLESAIERLLVLDPAEDVSDLTVQWEAVAPLFLVLQKV